MRRMRRSGMAAAAIACVSATLSAQAAFSRLGISDRDAGERFLSAVQDGGTPVAGARQFLALAPAARAAIVTEVAAWAKMYFQSAAFRKAWADTREANKPEAPSGTPDAQVSKQNADMEKQVAELRQMMASMPADQRKAVEDSIKQLEATAKDPAFQAQQKSMAANMNADDQKKYQDDLKQWQQNFPVDASPVLARRLRDFLAQTADVDFDAKLATRDGTKYFASPQDESKPAQWKMAYRAGRDATTAARAAASAWLKVLGQ